MAKHTMDSKFDELQQPSSPQAPSMTEPLLVLDCARVVVLHLWPTKEQAPTVLKVAGSAVRGECEKRGWKARPSNHTVANALALVEYRPPRPSSKRS